MSVYALLEVSIHAHQVSLFSSVYLVCRGVKSRVEIFPFLLACVAAVGPEKAEVCKDGPNPHESMQWTSPCDEAAEEDQLEESNLHLRRFAWRREGGALSLTAPQARTPAS